LNDHLVARRAHNGHGWRHVVALELGVEAFLHEGLVGSDDFRFYDYLGSAVGYK